MVNFIIFCCLAVMIVVMSILAVTAKKILRAATYLLFVLIGTAGLYLLLNYHFLAAVQVSVYAGGIVVLFIFAIFLTSNKGEMVETHNIRRIIYGVLTSVAGIALAGFVLLKHRFLYSGNATVEGDTEINMKMIGTALMGTEKYQYLLPFEVLSVLLLACIIGGILIARKK
ncbi:MAG: NADH-quinone oxidoreductase subunit J [Dysgonamonadaceae bacterium]|jgi:NADH-quinone oxidoreductase subunit J|nr:NADH-quinone oxidoreductase subunit J [Dysgonamonadaceae bacterium]